MLAFIKFNPQSILKFPALVMLAVALSGCFEPPPYNNLDNQQLKAMLKEGTPIFDIRRKEEWRETGVVARSKLLTFVDANGRLMPGFMEKFTSSVGKDEPVILICRTGNRTDVLARHLMDELGYTQVYNVRHGITDWIREGLAVTRPRHYR